MDCVSQQSTGIHHESFNHTEYCSAIANTIKMVFSVSDFPCREPGGNLMSVYVNNGFQTVFLDS